MTITPHPSYEFGFVDGLFVRAVADRGPEDDADREPDFIPATEVSVMFTPVVSARKIVDAPSMYVTKTPTAAVVAQDGRLRLRGQTSEPPGVGLIAGIYNVTFSGVRLPPIQIEVLPTHTEQSPLDLITALPYEPAPDEVVQLVALPTGGEPGQYLTPLTGGGHGWADAPSGGLEGRGFPGALDYAIGTTYTDLDATNGAVLWIKYGPALTDWRVLTGDTGWRDLSASLDPAILDPEMGEFSRFDVRRVDNVISFALEIATADNLPVPMFGKSTGVTLPEGLRGDTSVIQIPATTQDSAMKRTRSLAIFGNGRVYFYAAWGKTTLGSGGDAMFTYRGTEQTSEPWPTILPGIPA